MANNPETRVQVISNFMAWFNEVASACHREAQRKRPISGYGGRLCFRVCMIYVEDFNDIPETAGVFKTREDHEYVGPLMRDELKKRPYKYFNSSDYYFIIFTFRTRDGRAQEAVLTGEYDIQTKNSFVRKIFCASIKHVKVTMTTDERSGIFAEYYLKSLKSLAVTNL